MLSPHGDSLIEATGATCPRPMVSANRSRTIKIEYLNSPVATASVVGTAQITASFVQVVALRLVLT